MRRPSDKGKRGLRENLKMSETPVRTFHNYTDELRTVVLDDWYSCLYSRQQIVNRHGLANQGCVRTIIERAKIDGDYRAITKNQRVEILRAQKKENNQRREIEQLSNTQISLVSQFGIKLGKTVTKINAYLPTHRHRLNEITLSAGLVSSEG